SWSEVTVSASRADSFFTTTWYVTSIVQDWTDLTRVGAVATSVISTDASAEAQNGSLSSGGSPWVAQAVAVSVTFSPASPDTNAVNSHHVLSPPGARVSPMSAWQSLSVMPGGNSTPRSKSSPDMWSMMLKIVTGSISESLKISTMK